MTPSDFDRIARQNGLTRKQLVKLSLCQAEIYHRIRFCGLENSPESRFDLADIPSRELRTLNILHERGLISIGPGKSKAVGITEQGWRIPCNAGATVFPMGCDDSDIIALDPLDPVTRFGPQFPAF